MSLHESTFQYLKPTPAQVDTMAVVRNNFAGLAIALTKLLPDGPDKTFIMRELRTLAMWANVTITRGPDGSPRP